MVLAVLSNKLTLPSNYTLQQSLEESANTLAKISSINIYTNAQLLQKMKRFRLPH